MLAMLTRYSFDRAGLELSYLDAGGDGRPLIALHAHWLEAVTFEPLAMALAPAWRVVALDQRGHGESDHASSYERADYLADLGALLDHLGIGAAVLLGNSLGGVNAYQFATRHPERVIALIVEDIGAVIQDDTSFALAWGGIHPTRAALEQAIGPRFVPFLRSSFRHVNGGWRLAFDPRETVASQQALNGDHWTDWLASTCPALLIRGADSRVTSAAHLEEMASRRPNTRLVTLAGGHVVHTDNPDAFAETVRQFLETVETR